MTTFRRLEMVRYGRGTLLLLLAVASLVSMVACQKPDDDEEDLDVDDFVETSANPSPTNADSAIGSGRTYRVVRGNNQPDEILEFDWHTQFTVSVRLNNNATSKSVDLNFPVQIKSVSLKVEQASGGIVSPPTGGEVEHYDSVTSNVTANQFNAVNENINMTFDVWYDLPSLKKEALISVTIGFADDDNTQFTKVVQVRVNP
jgi:hypothetical protein